VALEINLLENAIYALYLLVMLGTFCLFKNTKGIYVCVTFLVGIAGNIYSINYSINQKMYEGNDSDIEPDSDVSTEESTEEEVEQGASILEDFKNVVDEIEDESEVLDTNPPTVAAEYDRLSREYTRIEQIIQAIAAEYRQKAMDAKQAAAVAVIEAADYDSETEARDNAADQREYNED
jgi:hypothetical protein